MAVTTKVYLTDVLLVWIHNWDNLQMQYTQQYNVVLQTSQFFTDVK